MVQCGTCPTTTSWPPPALFTLLGCNSSSGRDGVCWVDEEGNEELAGAGRTNLDGFDASKFLRTSAIAG